MLFTKLLFQLFAYYVNYGTHIFLILKIMIIQNLSVTNNTANGTSLIIKDVPIPAGSSLELMSGNKVVLETTDQITIDCDVADKLSGTLSVMEIT